MIAITEHADGVVLPVRAQPGAKRNALVGEHDSMLKVAVTQAPEAGKANQAIVALLASQLGISKSQIAQLAGKTGRQKRFLIRGVSVEELQRSLQRIMHPS